ncbi:MAG: hypothetical protein K2Q25_03680 [Mycobacteriaceae bacterium]|nr:hypothetical protein [Mycobacteriaceae bacterium]
MAHRLSVLAAADQQTADAVTVQADQVEQARWALGAILAFLAGTIAVAVIWLARCETEKATASPAAAADEAALIMFGTGVALAVTAAAIAVLIVQDDAAKHTRRSLDSVRDTYQQIVAQVAATLPTG